MLLNQIFPESDDKLFDYYCRETAQCIFAFEGKPELVKREGKLPYMLLGLMTVVNTEPFKVILRDNIGKLAFSRPRLRTACFLYVIYALVLFFLSAHEGKVDPIFIIGGAFYIVFSIKLLSLGNQREAEATQILIKDPQMRDAKKHLYRGNSVVFKKHIKRDLDYREVWYHYEPIACFIVSLLITGLPALVNPLYALVGAPLLVTSLCFWFNERFQVNDVWEQHDKKVQFAQHQIMMKQLAGTTKTFSQKAI